jgi:uncharacterized surface protein with fasciclin (FAS1) repeats
MALKLLAAIAALGLAAVPAYAEHREKKEAVKGDIVDTAVAAGQFTTLVAAVQAAGLEGALRAPGPITVFAPTDAAFAALPAGAVEDLLKPENKEKLTAILTYHVASGKTKSKDLAGKKLDVTTLNGATVAVDGTNGVRVGDAKVVTADIYASNGVIHVIDAVLLPPAAQ